MFHIIRNIVLRLSNLCKVKSVRVTLCFIITKSNILLIDSNSNLRVFKQLLHTLELAISRVQALEFHSFFVGCIGVMWLSCIFLILLAAISVYMDATYCFLDTKFAEEVSFENDSNQNCLLPVRMG